MKIGVIGSGNFVSMLNIFQECHEMTIVDDNIYCNTDNNRFVNESELIFISMSHGNDIDLLDRIVHDIRDINNDAIIILQSVMYQEREVV